MSSTELPTGTVTFLFTDIEGSTRLWEESPEAMRVALARHDAILEEAISAHGGVVFSRMGDGMAAAFTTARDAVGAALEAQQGLGGRVLARRGSGSAGSHGSAHRGGRSLSTGSTSTSR